MQRMHESFLIRTLLFLVSVYCIKTSDGAVSTQPNASHYIAEGEKTSINCSLKDEAFQGWFMNGERIPHDPSQRRHVKNDGNLWYSLNIRRVNRTDDGPYECLGETNKAQVMLYVEYHPVFISERSTNNTVYSSIGGNEEVTLTCVFDGFPVTRVRFNIFGEELNNSGITYAPGSASYRFLTESKSDFGFYTCEGTNSRGSASHTIEVHERGVSEPPNNIRASSSCNSVDVKWDPAEKDGGSPVIGYYIELRHEGKTLKSEYLKTSLRKKTFKDLEVKTLYEVRMNSENAFGKGEWRMVSINTTEACSSQALSSSAGQFPMFFLWVGVIICHVLRKLLPNSIMI
ncbi:axonal fasciculation [Porites harrisoni]